MKFRDILIVLLLLSLLLNLWLCHERLKGLYYRDGHKKGYDELTAKSISSVRQFGKLDIVMPDGRKVTLKPEKEEKSN